MIERTEWIINESDPLTDDEWLPCGEWAIFVTDDDGTNADFAGSINLWDVRDHDEDPVPHVWPRDETLKKMNTDLLALIRQRDDLLALVDRAAPFVRTAISAWCLDWDDPDVREVYSDELDLLDRLDAAATVR